MKQLFLVVATVVCIAYTTHSFAQATPTDVETSIEKLEYIIDDKDHESETTIEVKNGKLYVDGKKVSTLDKNTSIKIIKKNTYTENHSYDLGQMDIPFRPQMKSFEFSNRKTMLGVRTQDAQPGAKVLDVVDQSAADKAGLQNGDIIVAINGESIENSQELVAKIQEYKKDDQIKIQIERDGRAENLMAVLEAPSKDLTFFSNPQSRNFELPFKSFREMIDMPKDAKIFLSPTQNSNIGFEIEEDENGLIVSKVQPNSAADKAGLQAGDEIKTIESKIVRTLSDISQEINANKKNNEIYIGIQRAGASKSLPVVLPRAKKRAKF